MSIKWIKENWITVIVILLLVILFYLNLSKEKIYPQDQTIDSIDTGVINTGNEKQLLISRYKELVGQEFDLKLEKENTSNKLKELDNSILKVRTEKNSIDAKLITYDKGNFQ